MLFQCRSSGDRRRAKGITVHMHDTSKGRIGRTAYANAHYDRDTLTHKGISFANIADDCDEIADEVLREDVALDAEFFGIRDFEGDYDLGDLS